MSALLAPTPRVGASCVARARSGYSGAMTTTPHEPQPEPDTEAKPGVNDPNPAGTGSDEPLTPL